MSFESDVLSPPRPPSTNGLTARPWLIRKLATHDAAIVARHRYFHAEEKSEDLDAYAAWLKSRITDGTYLGSVALVDKKIVAGAGIVLLDWGPTRGHPTPYRGRVVNVFTEPQWRLQGIARALVTKILADCEMRGVKQFCLGTTPAAASIYRSLGFVPYEAEMVIKG